MNAASLSPAINPSLYPRREPMFKNLHDALCCLLGCGMFPTLALAVIYSPLWILGWLCVVAALVIWESIGWPKGEFNARRD